MRRVTSTNPTGPATPDTDPPPRPAPETAKDRKPIGKGGCLPWILLVALILGGVAIWKYPSFKARAELGAAYAARIGCSCRYVQGRDIESCQTDFEPGMEIVSVSDDPVAKAVTGNVPLLATRTARFAGASGCLLDPQER